MHGWVPFPLLGRVWGGLTRQFIFDRPLGELQLRKIYIYRTYGQPIMKRGTRGPAPRWRNPRKPAKTIVHVNSYRIRQNQKQQQQQPVITVKQGNSNVYGHHR